MWFYPIVCPGFISGGQILHHTFILQLAIKYSSVTIAVNHNYLVNFIIGKQFITQELKTLSRFAGEKILFPFPAFYASGILSSSRSEIHWKLALVRCRCRRSKILKPKNFLSHYNSFFSPPSKFFATPIKTWARKML